MDSKNVTNSNTNNNDNSKDNKQDENAIDIPASFEPSVKMDLEPFADYASKFFSTPTSLIIDNGIFN